MYVRHALAVSDALSCLPDKMFTFQWRNWGGLDFVVWHTRLPAGVLSSGRFMLPPLRCFWFLLCPCGQCFARFRHWRTSLSHIMVSRLIQSWCFRTLLLGSILVISSFFSSRFDAAPYVWCAPHGESGCSRYRASLARVLILVHGLLPWRYVRFNPSLFQMSRKSWFLHEFVNSAFGRNKALSASSFVLSTCQATRRVSFFWFRHSMPNPCSGGVLCISTATETASPECPFPRSSSQKCAHADVTQHSARVRSSRPAHHLCRRTVCQGKHTVNPTNALRGISLRLLCRQLYSLANGRAARASLMLNDY